MNRPNTHASPPLPTLLAVLTVGTLLLPIAAHADLSFETETARVLAPGKFEISMAAEYQHSRDGGEFALPLAFEIGVLPRLELLIEPTPYVGIYPKGEKKIHGVGDIEVTANFLAFEEREFLPAISFAVEVKAPTARNLNIGTRKTDVAFYVIGSKRFGDLDVHANVSYTILGKPSGVNVRNTWSLSLAGDYKINPKWDVYAEVTYITSARGPLSKSAGASGDGADGAIAFPTSPASPGPEGGVAASSGTAIAEVGGVELIGTVGVRHHLSTSVDVFGSISYDNMDAKLFRTGFTWKF